MRKRTLGTPKAILNGYLPIKVYTLKLNLEDRNGFGETTAPPPCPKRIHFVAARQFEPLPAYYTHHSITDLNTHHHLLRLIWLLVA